MQEYLKKEKVINNFLLLLFLFFFFVLNSCSPIGIITTSTGAGAVVAESDRTIGEAVDDVGIKIKIAEKYAKSKSGLFIDIDVVVKLGTVLLTGIVDDQETRIEAVKLVWEVKGVQEVINEIDVGNRQDIKSYANDLWISSKVRTKIIREMGLETITYNIETVNGKVHIMGIATSSEISEKLVKIIRSVRGVKVVANHIIIRSS